MNIQAIIFVILVGVTCSSCHPPTRHVLEPYPESIHKNHSVTGSGYVAVLHLHTNSMLRTRIKRSQSGKISLSPESAPPPYIRPDNSTKTNTTLPIQQPSRNTPSWISTLEYVITPIFRAVILLLTLLNVDITWRIHGQWLALPSHNLDLTRC